MYGPKIMNLLSVLGDYESVSGESKYHHYIPKFYLSFFTGRGKKRQVWVFDKRIKKKYKTNTSKIARENNFYTLEEDIEDPLIFEKYLSEIESKSKKVLESIIQTNIFPRDQANAEVLLYFLALTTSRLPQKKDKINDFTEKVVKLTGSLIKEKNPDLKDAIDLLEQGKIKAVTSQSKLVDLYLKSTKTIFNLNLQRNWQLIINETQHDFVTTDSPVCLIWDKPELRRGVYSPGYADKKSVIYFPISPKHCLVGHFTNFRKEIFFRNDRMTLALNSILIFHSYRYIFSKNSDCYYITDEEKITNLYFS